MAPINKEIHALEPVFWRAPNDGGTVLAYHLRFCDDATIVGCPRGLGRGKRYIWDPLADCVYRVYEIDFNTHEQHSQLAAARNVQAGRENYIAVFVGVF
jgi:hypothetical protein